MTETYGSYRFELSGGALCLDFVNTLGDRPLATEEHLNGFDDLLAWSRQANTLPAEDLDTLVRLAERHPARARAVFRRAVVLRETIYRIFSSLAGGETPAEEDLAALNSALPAAMRRLEVRRRTGAFEWTWGSTPDSLDRPLWPVIRSAADLLTSTESDRVRECASESCSWLFLDRSRNRRRRWCDMTTCGNRAKARRHYQRKKQGVRSKSPATS